MKFNQLVSSILNESSFTSKLPVLDGERELYLVSTSTPWPLYDGDVDDLIRWTYKSAIERCFDVDGEIDDEQTFYIGQDDYHKMVKALKQWFDDNWGNMIEQYEMYADENDYKSVKIVHHQDHVYNEFIKQLQPVSKLKLKRCKVLTLDHCISVAVEVDTDHYRFGGITDTISSTLDSTEPDISSW